MDKLLIDTDVILDFFFDRKPFSEEASIILPVMTPETYLKSF
jgi:predicted nucleic acid-binding protein